MGLGAVIFLTRSNQAQQSVSVPPTPTQIPPTITPTNTPSATPTQTPLPTPTGTSVIPIGGEQEAAVTNGEPSPGEAGTPGTDDDETQVPTESPTATPDGLQLPTQAPAGDVTATSTAVVQPPTAMATVTGTSTPAPVAQIPDSGGVLPTGDYRPLIWASLTLLVLLALGMTHHLRSTARKSEIESDHG